MTKCNHDCSSCSQNCAERKDSKSFIKKLNDKATVRKVIGVVSGKGGVGKSLVTSLLATYMQRKGYNTAILDADITGPSIPQVFGVHDKAQGDGKVIYPAVTRDGTQIMSINLLLEKETDPVVWRGPVIGGAVSQFWTDVVWDDVDFMFVDMPPGTGDVPLTVFQSLPVDGIVVVTSPQQLVEMIVGKAIKMASLMDVPVLGIVQNMSYFVCDDCGKKHYIYGDSRIQSFADDNDIKTVCHLPIDPNLATLCDQGLIEDAPDGLLDDLVLTIARLTQQ